MARSKKAMVAYATVAVLAVVLSAFLFFEHQNFSQQISFGEDALDVTNAYYSAELAYDYMIGASILATEEALEQDYLFSHVLICPKITVSNGEYFLIYRDDSCLTDFNRKTSFSELGEYIIFTKFNKYVQKFPVKLQNISFPEGISWYNTDFEYLLRADDFEKNSYFFSAKSTQNITYSSDLNQINYDIYPYFTTKLPLSVNYYIEYANIMKNCSAYDTLTLIEACFEDKFSGTYAGIDHGSRYVLEDVALPISYSSIDSEVEYPNFLIVIPTCEDTGYLTVDSSFTPDFSSDFGAEDYSFYLLSEIDSLSPIAGQRRIQHIDIYLDGEFVESFQLYNYITGYSVVTKFFPEYNLAIRLDGMQNNPGIFPSATFTICNYNAF